MNCSHKCAYDWAQLLYNAAQNIESSPLRCCRYTGGRKNSHQLRHKINFWKLGNNNLQSYVKTLQASDQHHTSNWIQLNSTKCLLYMNNYYDKMWINASSALQQHGTKQSSVTNLRILHNEQSLDSQQYSLYKTTGVLWQIYSPVTSVA